MNFSETIGISDDRLKGYVIIKDKQTGKILVNKHNMILKKGKEMILSKLIGGNFDRISNGDSYRDLENYNNYVLYKAIFYNNTSEVSYEDEIGSLSINVEDKNSGEGSEFDTDRIDINLDSNNMFLEDHNGHPALKIVLNIDFNNSNYGEDMTSLDERIFSSLSLVAKSESANSDNDNAILFSRIVFDPIIVTAESILNLVYYIYF